MASSSLASCPSPPPPRLSLRHTQCWAETVYLVWLIKATWAGNVPTGIVLPGRCTRQADRGNSLLRTARLPKFTNGGEVDGM